MNTKIITAFSSIFLTFSALPCVAQLVIPSDGSDGALNVTQDTTIDLSEAIDGTWSDDNTGGDIGKGVYDADKWAVVFEYGSVNIASGMTLDFINHPTKAPVVWLVDGSVTIDGNVNLDGEGETDNDIEGLQPRAGGPGGFRGGPRGPEGLGAGLGPGGMNGGFASASGSYRDAYGNPAILPLIGGSGSGASSHFGLSGAGGGGAIFIAAKNSVSVGGSITANGGGGFSNGDGSGGAVKIIADSVTGSGAIQAVSDGRIRIETSSLSTDLQISPETVAVAPDDPPVIWPPENAPTVRITHIDGVAVPADPRAPLQASADVAIENNDPVTVLLETTNFPTAGVVELRVAEKYGGFSWLTATLDSGTLAQATWSVTTTLADGFSALQARATVP